MQLGLVFVFTGEHFQSQPMNGGRDNTRNNELQYIPSCWRNCTSSCCLLFDERMSSPILTSCEMSSDTAPAMSGGNKQPCIGMDSGIDSIQKCRLSYYTRMLQIGVHPHPLAFHTHTRSCCTNYQCLRLMASRVVTTYAITTVTRADRAAVTESVILPYNSSSSHFFTCLKLKMPHRLIWTLCRFLPPSHEAPPPLLSYHSWEAHG